LPTSHALFGLDNVLLPLSAVTAADGAACIVVPAHGLATVRLTLKK
jgi:hypothetical protein